MTRSVAKYAQVREFCQSLEIENEDGSKTKTGIDSIWLTKEIKND